MHLYSPSIEYLEGRLKILDQEKLPTTIEWVEVRSPDHMVEILRSLKVRGAPLIGVAASLSLAQVAAQGIPFVEIVEMAGRLRLARPTAVNLAACVDRIMAAAHASSDPLGEIQSKAREIFEEDVALCRLMGERGASLIERGESILTICNTGSLATAGIGTALGVIRTAHEQGKKIHVYVCETRPLLQGGRLTAWELEQSGIPYTLICDSMAATLMRDGKIDRVLVGADRIAANGDFANKIGTYSLAVLAHHHQIPFHPVAPYTTVDFGCPDGDAIEIEERSPHEVRGFLKQLIWSPLEAPVYNPSFDVTPATLVTSHILDRPVAFRPTLPLAFSDALIEAGHALHQKGLLPACAGNLSVRWGDQIAITASGAHKGYLTRQDLLLTDLQGNPHNPKQTPSSDTRLHTLIYSLFPQTGAAVHVHTFEGVVLTKLRPDASSITTRNYALHRAFPQIKTHASAVTVPIFPDSEDVEALSRQIGAYLKEHPETLAFMLQNHGLYTWGQDLQEAQSRVEAFEYLFGVEARLASSMK